MFTKEKGTFSVVSLLNFYHSNYYHNTLLISIAVISVKIIINIFILFLRYHFDQYLLSHYHHYL